MKEDHPWPLSDVQRAASHDSALWPGCGTFTVTPQCATREQEDNPGRERVGLPLWQANRSSWGRAQAELFGRSCP